MAYLVLKKLNLEHIYYSKTSTGPHKTFNWAACGPRSAGWT